MDTTAGDLSLFDKITDRGISGLLATHVDDTLGARAPQFVKEVERIQLTFDSKPRMWNTVLFAGIYIARTKTGFRMHQAPYARKLQLLPLGADFDLFRAREHELACLTHTRPDRLAPVTILSQVTATTHNTTHTHARSTAPSSRLIITWSEDSPKTSSISALYVWLCTLIRPL